MQVYFTFWDILAVPFMPTPTRCIVCLCVWVAFGCNITCTCPIDTGSCLSPNIVLHACVFLLLLFTYTAHWAHGKAFSCLTPTLPYPNHPLLFVHSTKFPVTFYCAFISFCTTTTPRVLGSILYLSSRINKRKITRRKEGKETCAV